LEAAVNWVLVKAKRFPGLKVVKKTREKWDSKLNLFLAAIGYAVGLGNVWYFRIWHTSVGVVS
jgi:hypothetical protein